MKKILIILLLLCCISQFPLDTAAASLNPQPLPTLTAMPLREFVQLKPREMAAVLGQPLSRKERLALQLLKPSMRKAIRKNPSISTASYFASQRKMKTWLKVLLILAGILLLAFIVFAVAYGSNQ